MSANDPFLEALRNREGGDEVAVIDAEKVGADLGMTLNEIRRRVAALAANGAVEDTTGAGEPISVRIRREGGVA